MFYLTFLLSTFWFQEPICQLEVVVCQQEYSVEQLIEIYADDPVTAKRIASCESQMGKYRKNWSGSSATGLFQFMPKTFNAYCSGDIENDIDQIRCFNKLYPNHQSWWECK